MEYNWQLKVITLEGLKLHCKIDQNCNPFLFYMDLKRITEKAFKKLVW